MHVNVFKSEAPGLNEDADPALDGLCPRPASEGAELCVRASVIVGLLNSTF